jgi:hypothetical protein
MQTEPLKAEQPKRQRRWFQFSLRTLMIFIVAASLALEAMRFATSAWANAIVSFTMLALIFSLVLAVYRRPFWIGFAICGISYLVLVESHFAGDFVDHLITTQSVDSLREVFHPEADSFVRPSPNGQSTPAVLVRRPGWEVKARNFHLIGSCLWVLILGALGGMLAQFAASRSRSHAASESHR